MEPPDIDKRRQVEALTAQLAAHPYSRVYSDWRSLNRVLQAYVTNADLLTSQIAAPESDTNLVIRFMHEAHEGGYRQEYFDEVFRFLHNCLAILTTLIDHARNLMKQYAGTDFNLQYQNRVTTLSERPEASFLRDLRNYLLHVSMVPLSIDITIQRTDPVSSFEVILISRTLLEWSRWKPASKCYLEAHAEILLRQCVEAYTEQNIDLYEWVFAQSAMVHAEDHDDYRRMQNELQGLME